MNPPQTPPGDEGDPSSKRDSDNNPEAIPPESQALMKAVEAMGKATENHDVAGAIQSVGQLFALVMADPSKYARAPDGIRERAWACQARGDVAGAEAAWREVIALEEQTGEARFIAKAHLDMGTFLMQTDQDDRALAHSEGVVAAARRTDLEILVWHALEQRTCCALRLGRFRLALETAEEGVRTTAGNELLARNHAWARILRAACRVELGEHAQALEDLEASRSVAAENPVAIVLPGLCWWLTRWWEVTARVRLHQQDVAGSREACETVVGLRRRLFEGSHGSWRHLVSALRQQAEVLRIDGQPDEAAAAEAEAGRIEMEFRV
ncbi:MAG: hypothetical protein ACKOEQ_07670 [Verrucomicrobiota bacterium]